MPEFKETEEMQFGRHFYRYLITVAIAIFGLFLMSVEPEILRQFRSWISPATFNSYLLTWFAVSTIACMLSFFWGMICQVIRGGNCLWFIIWYLGIFCLTLFFATIFFQIVRGEPFAVLMAKLISLLVSNLVTVALVFLFFIVNFTQKHNFWPFALGIMAATTAYTWLYLSMIARIAVL